MDDGSSESSTAAALETRPLNNSKMNAIDGDGTGGM